MSETTTAVLVNATFITVAKYEKVLVKCPGENDKHFKFIQEHSIEVAGSVVDIKAHYRRGDFIDKEIVTKHFFVEKKHFNTTVVATVELVEKTDHLRGEKKCFLLNITPKESADRPTCRLKIGTDKKSEASYQIPGTERFISFETI